MATRKIVFSQLSYLKAPLSQRKEEAVINALIGILTFSGIEKFGRAFSCQFESGFCQVPFFRHQYTSLLFTSNQPLCIPDRSVRLGPPETGVMLIFGEPARLLQGKGPESRSVKKKLREVFRFIENRSEKAGCLFQNGGGAIFTMLPFRNT